MSGDTVIELPKDSDGAYILARGEAIDDPVHEVRSIMNKILRYNAVVK